MSVPLVVSSIMLILLGIIHSFLGERLIFRGLLSRLMQPERPVLSAHKVRVLRSAWHLVTLLGVGLGAVLLAVAIPAFGNVASTARIIAITTLICALYWGVGTRGRHPAWIVFLLVAALCWWG